MPVFIGSTPNVQTDDLLLAKDILNGEKDINGSIDELKSKFHDEVFLFNRGRDSLFFFLNLLNLKDDDEVLVQAFTCVAVVAPLLWSKAKPVYVDIDPKSFNMDLDLLREKISEETRVILIQHTFGNLADVRRVREFVDGVNNEREEERKIYIIEDCAHLFTNNFFELNIGQYSDAFFFSFSQDKAISCTQGAMLVVKDPVLLPEAQKEYVSVKELSLSEAMYNAKYITLWNRIKESYFKRVVPFTNITLGRILIILFRLLGIIKKQASNDTLMFSEPKKLSEIQACLLLNQLGKSEELNKHREKIVNIYHTGIKDELRFNSINGPLLRYPILISNREEVKEKLKEKGIIGGIWYSSVVFPLMGNLNLVNYKLGDCPNAEMCAKSIFNLPTNIETTENDVNDIVDVVNTFANPSKF